MINYIRSRMSSICLDVLVVVIFLSIGPTIMSFYCLVLIVITLMIHSHMIKYFQNKKDQVIADFHTMEKGFLVKTINELTKEVVNPTMDPSLKDELIKRTNELKNFVNSEFRQ